VRHGRGQIAPSPTLGVNLCGSRKERATHAAIQNGNIKHFRPQYHVALYLDVISYINLLLHSIKAACLVEQLSQSGEGTESGIHLEKQNVNGYDESMVNT
jgi:hypothetical protein